MRAAPPQRTFADLEFLHQGIHLDPTLQAISDLLDQHGETIELVRQDLQRGLKKPTPDAAASTPRRSSAP